MEVAAERPEEMNLIALFMRAALEERREALDRIAPRGDLALTVDRMSATLSFTDGRVVVRNGVTGRPRAHIKGSMESFIALARGRLSGPLLTRRVRVSGNPLAALPLARLFKQTAQR